MHMHFSISSRIRIFAFNFQAYFNLFQGYKILKTGGKIGIF